MQVIAYSTISIEMPYRYQLQTQAPNGTWVKNMASDDAKMMCQHAEWLQANEGIKVRVVDMHA